MTKPLDAQLLCTTVHLYLGKERRGYLLTHLEPEALEMGRYS